jgi:hypothetical protein
MSGSTVLIIIGVLAVLWVPIVVLLIALCRMAARGDAAENLGQMPPDQSPRRPSTWGTVRKRIFTSPQSDQFATYK